MKILSFSSSFPSSAVPTDGIFVFDRLSALARLLSVTVVHPVPVCPLIGPVGGRQVPASSEMVGNLEVHHRRYKYVPALLKRYDGYFYYRGLFRWAADLCRKDMPDLLDAHFAWPDGIGVSLIARRLGLPYVVTLRGTINPRYRTRSFRSRLAGALRGAAAVISVSGPMAEIAVQLGAQPGRVHVIPNGVDGQTFRPIDRAEARRQLGLQTDGTLLVCVGSLKRPKGQEDLILAVSLLRHKPLLVLIGSPAGGAGYLRRLRNLTRRLGLEGQVRFAGTIDRAAVAAYLNAADLSVLPSHSEGCPNVVLESLACGTPVVATNVGAVPDLLRPSSTGLVVPPGDCVALAEVIGEALRRKWSRQAIRNSIQERTWQTVADEVVGVFRLAIGS